MELRQIPKLEKKIIKKRQVDFDDKSYNKKKYSHSNEDFITQTNNNIENLSDNFPMVKNKENNSENNVKINKPNFLDKKVSEVPIENNAKIEIKTKVNTTLEEISSKKSQTKTLSISNKETNIHKNHRQRLKSQFLNNGISYLTDIQKLELLLFYAIPQKDTNPIAHRLINEFGSLKEVFSADFNKLINVNGVKDNTALLIKLVNSLNSILAINTKMDCIGTARDAKDFCTNLFKCTDVEQFYVICLTKTNHIKKCKMVQAGSGDEISIQIRNITELALDSKCNRIIVTHNHPNGEARMSDEDCTFTYTLICSCLLNSIDLVDHIIVGVNSTISLASQKVIQKLKAVSFRALSITNEKQMLLSSISNEYSLDKTEKPKKFKFDL